MKKICGWLVGFVAVGVVSACVGSNPYGNGGSTAAAGSGGTTQGTATPTSGTGGAVSSSAFAGAAGARDIGAATVVTSAEGAYWQQGLVTEATSGDADFTINHAVEAQTWQGFGGGFTELGWVYLSTLPVAERERAMQLLFGPEGARFAWGRIPIGGNDYVLSRYTLDDTGDDVPPDSTESNRPPADLTLSKFSIARDLQNLIPYIKAAQAANPELRFWAVPWTPPVWMKTGHSTVDWNGGAAKKPSYYDGGSMKADSETLKSHAQYFVKFIQAYRDQGIHIELVGPQNEPSAAQTYPSCVWDKAVYTSFIGNYLGPALTGAGLNTKIMLGGSFDSTKDSAFVNAVLANATAKGYCAVAGLGYDMVEPSRVAAIQSAGMPIWVSEHKAGNYPWLTSTYQTTPPNDMAYAIETWGLIRDAITKSGVSLYSAWHMALDKGGKNIDTSIPWPQNTLLVADSGKLTPTPAYYVFRHFSRYVELGAKVVGATALGANSANVVAFKNPGGGLVAVLYNPGSAKTIRVALGGQTLQFSAPSNGFATLVKP